MQLRTTFGSAVRLLKVNLPLLCANYYSDVGSTPDIVLSNCNINEGINKQ